MTKQTPYFINNVSEQILHALAKYRFLTITQMMKVKVGTVSVRYLRQQLKSLRHDRKRPLVGAIEYAPSGPRRGGRYEYFYYLKPQGKKVLVESFGVQEESIRIPAGVPQFHSMYHHRRMQIDFHIALSKWTQEQNIDIMFFENDFDTIGGNRTGRKLESVTKVTFPKPIDGIKFIIPDGAFLLNIPQGLKFYLTEFHRGTDVKRAVKQLYHHAVAIGQGLPSRKYGLSVANRVVMIFEIETTLNSVVRELQKLPSFQNLGRYFIFKAGEQVDSDFGRNWLQIDGTLSNLL